MKFIKLIALLAAVLLAALLGKEAADALTAYQARKPVGNSLVARQTEVFLEGAGTPPYTAVSFILENRGPSAVTITDVKSSCSCLVSKSAAGSVVLPGAEFELSAEVAAPDEGFLLQTLEVSHSAAPRPLELTVRVAGRRPHPYLTRESQQRVAFPELDAATPPPRPFAVLAVEDGRDAPWLTRITCTLPEAVVSRPEIVEQHNGPHVLRTYRCDVSLSRLPPGTEFIGRLRAEMRDGTERDLGTVTGTVVRAYFTPRRAVLDKDNGWAEVVVFKAASASGLFRVRPGWASPPWLSLAWENESGRQSCSLRALTKSAPSETDIIVPLVRDDGVESELPIRLAP